MMRPAVALLCLLAASACAPLQERRSPAEAACAAEAERLVLERNRGRSVRLDSPGTGAQTIMEETNVSASFARESEFAERRRLTRECLERQGRQADPGAAPAQAPAGAPAARPAAQPPGGLQRGTALPPPAPAEPPVRGW